MLKLGFICTAIRRETTVSMCQTKINQFFKLVIGLGITDETRFEPNHLKRFYLNRIGQKVMKPLAEIAKNMFPCDTSAI